LVQESENADNAEEIRGFYSVSSAAPFFRLRARIVERIVNAQRIKASHNHYKPDRPFYEKGELP